MSAAQTGRTHGCSDQCCNVKILLANPEPSTHGPSRHFGVVRNWSLSAVRRTWPDLVLI
jgi:hypothetical protein